MVFKPTSYSTWLMHCMCSHTSPLTTGVTPFQAGAEVYPVTGGAYPPYTEATRGIQNHATSATSGVPQHHRERHTVGAIGRNQLQSAAYRAQPPHHARSYANLNYQSDHIAGPQHDQYSEGEVHHQPGKSRSPPREGHYHTLLALACQWATCIMYCLFRVFAFTWLVHQ